MSFNARNSRENEILRDLATVREAIREVITGGVNVGVTGGVTVGRVSLKDLREQEQYLLGQLGQLRGAKSYTVPDWSGEGRQP